MVVPSGRSCRVMPLLFKSSLTRSACAYFFLFLRVFLKFRKRVTSAVSSAAAAERETSHTPRQPPISVHTSRADPKVVTQKSLSRVSPLLSSLAPMNLSIWCLHLAWTAPLQSTRLVGGNFRPLAHAANAPQAKSTHTRHKINVLKTAQTNARGKSSSIRMQQPQQSTTVIENKFNLAIAFIAFAALTLAAPWLIGGFALAVGLLILVQTARIRFVFDDKAFEVKALDFDSILSGDLSQLTTTGENFAVGGENRWNYDSFVNYEFFPSIDLPVLVYFKETQTPRDKWDVGPGKWANSEKALAKGAVAGQVHFFPCIGDARALQAAFESKGCAKL